MVSQDCFQDTPYKRYIYKVIHNAAYYMRAMAAANLGTFDSKMVLQRTKTEGYLVLKFMSACSMEQLASGSTICRASNTRRLRRQVTCKQQFDGACGPSKPMDVC
ncbi:hypothetical protein BS78_07G098100 [Paspalum vaginatum]|nr:hypothetical protein BS78_07G098100 [Paspalum vaginatum]